MKISDEAKKKLVLTEEKLSQAGFESVWQHLVERTLYDCLYTLWVNLQNGKSVMVLTGRNGISVYEVTQTTLSDAIGQLPENVVIDE